MKPLPYQIDKAKIAYSILQRYGYVYIQGQPRTGKTPISLLIAEQSKATRWLILTPKKAISGWEKFIQDEEFTTNNTYTVTNYEQVGSVKDKKILLKLDKRDYDAVIIDESHNLGHLGRANSRYKVIKSLVKDYPHIHLSGTAIVESPCTIYHQMSISKYTPFKFSNFYLFHKVYGIPYTQHIAGRVINKYDKYKPELLTMINKFSLYITQDEAGVLLDRQVQDKVHYITLNDTTTKWYNTILKDRIIDIDGNLLVCDSIMKLRVTLHMLESGIAKTLDGNVVLGNTEKIDYIRDTFGDDNLVGVMCNFVYERDLVKKLLPNVEVYSSTADAEGVDLSHLNTLVILSSGYSGAKFIQRRERLVNVMNNTNKQLVLHHLVVKDAISDQVYIACSSKRDFNNSTYTPTNI